MFHLVGNAVKYSLNSQNIVIEFKLAIYDRGEPVQFEESKEPIQAPNSLENFIETKVTNYGTCFHNKK